MNPSLSAKIQAANATLIVEGNLDAISEFFAPDYVAHLTGQDMAGGHAEIRKFLALIQRSFTNIRVDVEVLVETKDRIAWQRTLRGIHQAAFKGFPGSGREIIWRDMVTSRFRDGLFVEDWVLSDLAERLLFSRKQ